MGNALHFRLDHATPNALAGRNNEAQELGNVLVRIVKFLDPFFLGKNKQCLVPFKIENK